MRTMIDTMPEEPAPSQDVTLGLAALTGIFLAVVLVCALFFGFGYSTGRTLHAGGATTQSVTAAATNAVASPGQLAVTSPALAPAEPVAKPSAGTAYMESDLPPGSEAEADPAPRQAERSARPAAQSSTAPNSRPGLTARAAALPPGAAPSAAGVMVQIAAVAHQGDADALAASLRKSGYTAIVHTEPQDRFLHVQVGPFATRDEARTMRSRLQADGYNAFMKP